MADGLGYNLIFLRIRDRLMQDTAAHNPDVDGQTNYASELLTAFLNNGDFRQGVVEAATELDRQDIVREVEQTEITPSRWDGAVNHMVQGVKTGDLSSLPTDLQADPQILSLSMEQLQTFVNVVANLENGPNADPEVLTHLKADPRFVSFMKQYAEANEFTGDGAEKILEDVRNAHNQANATLDTIEYGGLQMQYMAGADTIFERVVASDYAALGEGLTQHNDNNYFSGQGVSKPLEAEALAPFTVPLEEPVVEPDPPAPGEGIIVPSEPAIAADTNVDSGSVWSWLFGEDEEKAPETDNSAPVTATPEQPETGVQPRQAFAAAASGEQPLPSRAELEAEAARLDTEIGTDARFDFITDTLEAGGVNPDGAPSELAALTEKYDAIGAAENALQRYRGSPIEYNEQNGIMVGVGAPQSIFVDRFEDRITQAQNAYMTEYVALPEEAKENIHRHLGGQEPAPAPAPEPTIRDGNPIIASAVAGELPQSESPSEAVSGEAPDTSSAEVETESTQYEVARGDNLWNIAKNEYGLTSYQDIMRAMDHIAHANPELALDPNHPEKGTYNLAQGANAHNVFPGQKLNMPTAEDVAKPVESLDYEQLDRQVGQGLKILTNDGRQLTAMPG